MSYSNNNNKSIPRESHLSKSEEAFIYQVAPNFDRYRNEVRERIIDDFKLGSKYRQNNFPKKRENSYRYSNQKSPLTLLQDFENILIQRIWFEGNDQSEFRWQAGEYCGICRNKSRPSEEKDGLCECVRSHLEQLKQGLTVSFTTFDRKEEEKEKREDERRVRYQSNYSRGGRFSRDWRRRDNYQQSNWKTEDKVEKHRGHFQTLDESLPKYDFDDVYDLSFPLSDTKIKEIKSIRYWKQLLNYIYANPKELFLTLFFGHSSVVNHRFLHLLYIKRILTQEEYEDYTERYENWGGKYDHITSYSQLQKELDDELDELVSEREDYYYNKNQKRRRVIKKAK